MDKAGTIIFDFDGTLHNSIPIYIPACKKALSYIGEQHGIDLSTFKDSQILEWIGKPPEEAWQTSFPGLPPAVYKECVEIVGREMELLISRGRAKLYPGAIEILQRIHDVGYTLLLVSNCREYYITSHNAWFNLERFFKHMICTESYGFNKSHVFRLLRPALASSVVVIGDRKQDIDAGSDHNFTTIGCSYGFGLPGELDHADHIIDALVELPELLAKIH